MSQIFWSGVCCVKTVWVSDRSACSAWLPERMNDGSSHQTLELSHYKPCNKGGRKAPRWSWMYVSLEPGWMSSIWSPFFSKSNFNEYLILYLPSLCFSLTGCYFRNRVQWDKTTSHFWVGPEAWVSMAVALGAVFGELVPSKAAETLLWISSSWQLRLMVLCVWTGVRRAPFLISLFWGARKPAWGTDWFWQNLGVHWTSVRCFRESFSILNDKSANSGFDLLLRWS